MSIFNENQLNDLTSNRTYRDGSIMTMKCIIKLLNESIDDITGENSIDTKLGYCMAVNDLLDIINNMINNDQFDKITMITIRNAIMHRKRGFIDE